VLIINPSLPNFHRYHQRWFFYPVAIEKRNTIKLEFVPRGKINGFITAIR